MGCCDAVMVSARAGPAVMALVKEGHCDAVMISSCAGPAMMLLRKEGHGDAVMHLHMMGRQ